MKEGFEDAFMDAQSAAISSCIEVLNSKNIEVDFIYVYLFQNGYQDFPNAFFKKDNRILKLNDILDDDSVYELLDMLIEDIENMIKVCDTYEGKCPNEWKLIYEVHTGKFDAEYGYDDFVDEDHGLVTAFKNWRESCS